MKNERILLCVAELRYLIQRGNKGDWAEDFHRKVIFKGCLGSNRHILDDDIPISNPEQNEQVRITFQRLNIDPLNTDSNPKLPIRIRVERNELIGRSFLEPVMEDRPHFHTIHAGKNFDKFENFQALEIMRREGGEIDQNEIKRSILRIIHDFSNSTTFSRGQATMVMMLVRAFARNLGFHLFLIGNWHLGSNCFPYDVDALLNFDREGDFVENNIGNILLVRMDDMQMEEIEATNWELLDEFGTTDWAPAPVIESLISEGSREEAVAYTLRLVQEYEAEKARQARVLEEEAKAVEKEEVLVSSKSFAVGCGQNNVRTSEERRQELQRKADEARKKRAVAAADREEARQAEEGKKINLKNNRTIKVLEQKLHRLERALRVARKNLELVRELANKAVQSSEKAFLKLRKMTRISRLEKRTGFTAATDEAASRARAREAALSDLKSKSARFDIIHAEYDTCSSELARYRTIN